MGHQSDTPRFRYYLSNVLNPVDQNDPLWDDLLPVNRKQKRTGPVAITYKDYFSAARSFMEHSGVTLIEHLLSIEKDESVNISELWIFLEKHGEFYHPSRVEVKTPEKTVSFVLNVAVSEAGRKCMENEVEQLKRLHRKYGHSYIPKIYGQGEIVTDRGRRLSMFLGDWFDDFHEFHLSVHPNEKQHRIRVWTPGKDVWLTTSQTRALYRHVAFILTHFYDVETYEQILSWHHAAGDFVVCLGYNTVKLKLITVRRYGAMVDGSDRDLKSMFDALLVFFLNLSIRARLDRLDGVGDIIWADDISLYGIMEGFFDALSKKTSMLYLPAPLTECFQRYLGSRIETELFEYGEAVVDAYGRSAPEAAIMQAHLSKHIRTLYQLIQNKTKY